MSDEVLVKVENVSKKFCRDLKKSLWYGVRDIAGELFARNGAQADLRPDEFWALRDVSFELRRGECLGLIGRNGAGKSTLLKLLNGLMKPDRGRITVRGRIGALIELGAGFSPILTGRENIYVNAAVLGIPRRRVDRIIDEIIDFAGISEFIDTPVQSYSSGMRVRLGFAIAAHFDPDVLLVDEVLAVGDLAFQQKCLANMRNRIANGSTIVFVSHNIRVVQFICNKILLLNKGRMEALDSPTTVAERYLSLLAENQARDKSCVTSDESSVSSGTGVTVTSVRLFDAEGTPTTKFKTGDRLQLEVVVDANRRIEQPSLAVTVWTQDGVRVASLSSRYLGLKIPEIDGKKSFRCVIDPLNLMPGRYVLRGGVYDAFAGFPYDQWGWEDRLLSFTVVSKLSRDESLVLYDGLGITTMEFQWHEVQVSV